jgi:hypothetical protein
MILCANLKFGPFFAEIFFGKMFGLFAHVCILTEREKKSFVCGGQGGAFVRPTIYEKFILRIV